MNGSLLLRNLWVIALLLTNSLSTRWIVSISLRQPLFSISIDKLVVLTIIIWRQWLRKDEHFYNDDHIKHKARNVRYFIYIHNGKKKEHSASCWRTASSILLWESHHIDNNVTERKYLQEKWYESTIKRNWWTHEKLHFSWPHYVRSVIAKQMNGRIG